MFLESVITEHSLIDQNPRKLIGENMSEYLSNDKKYFDFSMSYYGQMILPNLYTFGI